MICMHTLDLRSAYIKCTLKLRCIYGPFTIRFADIGFCPLFMIDSLSLFEHEMTLRLCWRFVSQWKHVFRYQIANAWLKTYKYVLIIMILLLLWFRNISIYSRTKVCCCSTASMTTTILSFCIRIYGYFVYVLCQTR